MRTFFFATIFFVAASTTARAGLLGDTVNLQWFFPEQSTLFCDNGNQVVGAGVEYPQGCGGFSTASVDVDDTGFFVGPSDNLLTFGPSSFNGFKITNVTGPEFSSVRG